MRTEQLRYLMTVIRAGSMRRAAEELHLSQAALSESIRSLEGELGVRLVERRREGTRISDVGRELLPHINEILEQADRMSSAASDHRSLASVVRIGTVAGATVPLLAPALQSFQQAGPGAQAEIVTALPEEIHQAIRDGALDIGLFNAFRGDDRPPDMVSTEVLRGRPVVCCSADSPLAEHATVSMSSLREEPFIAMRPGYLMHRLLYRTPPDRRPPTAYLADGAEMGKLMVAEGLGATILPDYSVQQDPFQRLGVITWRPIEGEQPEVVLLVERRRSAHLSGGARRLEAALISQGAVVESQSARLQRAG